MKDKTLNVLNLLFYGMLAIPVILFLPVIYLIGKVYKPYYVED